MQLSHLGNVDKRIEQNRLEQVSRGSRIPPTSATPKRKHVIKEQIQSLWPWP